MDRLDPKGIVRHRLSRVATKYENGKHFRVWWIFHAIFLVVECVVKYNIKCFKQFHVLML
jgi:hypothetical protein